MTDPFADRFYRPDEIATALGVSTRTIYRLIHSIESPLPASRLSPGGPLRVHGRDLNAYLAAHAVNPLEE